MDSYTGRAVVSSAGHDKGLVLCVIGTEGGRLLLADGRHRKVQSPKKKQLKHIVFIEDAAVFSGPLTNKALWAHLRAIKAQYGQVST